LTSNGLGNFQVSFSASGSLSPEAIRKLHEFLTVNNGRVTTMRAL
jgi:hypothetical protein